MPHAAPNARILVVEDEALPSIMVENVLVDLGCEVAGPAASLERAITLASNERLSGALLDVNIRGESVYPVADILLRREIPFIFLTGYRQTELKPPHDRAPLLEKPFDEPALMRAVRVALLGSAPSSYTGAWPSASRTAATRESGR